MPPRPPRPGPPPPLGLDLKHFLLRSEALHLYRAFLRVAARAPSGGSGGGTGSSPRAELVATIRAEFERAKGGGNGGGGEAGGGGKSAAAASTQAIKHAIADGKLQLKRLEETLGMQR